ncbi:unnamed protein product [Musa textilis]
MRRRVTTSVLSIAIFFLLAASFSLHVFRHLLPSGNAINSRTLTQPVDRLRNYAVGEAAVSVLRVLRSPPRHRSPPMESVLLLDWEVLLLPSPNTPTAASGGQLSCLFHTGATSPARPAGPVAFLCSLPNSLRRFRPFYTPRLSGASSNASGWEGLEDPPREMLRSTQLAYESVSTGDDVIVFVKGVNRRRDRDLPASSLRCVFSPASGGAAVATTSVTSSAQEAFRCAHPPAAEVSRIGPLRVSISTGPEAAPTPTLADYHRPRGPARGGRLSICACTMVFNAAKFLPEWVVYHAAIGVERFFLYDNGSEDELESVVSRLGSQGFNVSTRFWPWPKTQEAGFSHCAVVNRDECEWMAFIDVDEFVYSTDWDDSDRPNRSMMGALVAVGPEVGQISIRCLEFGPSGHRAHPLGGVTQGYTCRRRNEERHKSLLRLDAVAFSLVNSVHHFELQEGFQTKQVEVGEARLNHYKYQAWKEFKAKFRRRVSAYVVDWKEPMNLASKDRPPGLGSDPIEPKGWTDMFCEVNDTRLRDATRRCRWILMSSLSCRKSRPFSLPSLRSRLVFFVGGYPATDLIVLGVGITMKRGKSKADAPKKADGRLSVKKGPERTGKKPRKTKADKDPNKPKRPPSAFFVFMEEFRKSFKEKNPNNKSVSVVGKAAGDKWKSMSEAEKAPYVAKAAKFKTEYTKKLAAYNKNQSGGGSHDADEEDESDKSSSEVNDDDEGSGEEEEDDE